MYVQRCDLHREGEVEVTDNPELAVAEATEIDAPAAVAEILPPVVEMVHAGTWELRRDVLKALFDRSLVEMERLLALAEEKALVGEVDQARVLAEIADRWRNVVYI